VAQPLTPRGKAAESNRPTAGTPRVSRVKPKPTRAR
jgi:hypothetical protein